MWTSDNSFLLKYYSKIEHGDILVGEELWTELNRLKEDISTRKYLYDTTDANLRINFLEN